MIEHLLDEALLNGLRDGRDHLDWQDVQDARLTEEVGLKNPVAYTPTSAGSSPPTRPGTRRSPSSPNAHGSRCCRS
jgi:hypothetical protein